MLLASFVAAIDSLKPACSSDTNKLVDECCASQETTYDYATNPLACLMTNESACGGRTRGRCVAASDAYTEAGWRLDSNNTCFFLALQAEHAKSGVYRSNNNVTSDGLCRCNAGYDRVDCAWCALGYTSDGAGGCVKRAVALPRRSLASIDEATATRLLQGFADPNVTGDTTQDYSHSSVGPAGPGGTTTARTTPGGINAGSLDSDVCVHVDMDTHASGWFLLWHRSFFAVTEQSMAELGYLSDMGVPYLNLSAAANPGDVLFALEPDLTRDGACPVFPLRDIVAESDSWIFDEASMLSPSNFADFAYNIRTLHVATLCWFSAIGYIESDFCIDMRDDFGIGAGDVTAIRAATGHSCAGDEGTFRGGVGNALHSSNGDDAPGIFVFHMYLDALLEMWEQLHGREKACDPANADALRFGSTDKPYFTWHPDQCLAMTMLNHFELSYRSACEDPSERLGFTFDFDAWNTKSAFFEAAENKSLAAAQQQQNDFPAGDASRKDKQLGWIVVIANVFVSGMIFGMIVTFLQSLKNYRRRVSRDENPEMMGYDLGDNEAAKAAVKMPPEDHEDAELDGYPAADK